MQFKKSTFLFFLMVVFATISLHAQNQNSNYNFVNVTDEVIKVGMYSINQDSEGFIWIGTNGGGLYKFDGVQNKSYKSDIKDTKSISSNLIFKVYLDVKDRLWIGTEEGLNLYNRDFDNFERYYFNEDEKNGLSNVQIASIKGDKDGNLFLGTFEKGMFYLKNGSKHIEKIPYQNGKNSTINVNDISITKHGKVYAATNKGLKEFDESTKILRSTVLSSDAGLVNIDEQLKIMLFDSSQNLWLGTLFSGLIKVSNFDADDGSPAKIEHFNFTEKRILSMVETPEGKLLVGTENDGLFHLDSNGKLLKNYVYDKTDKNSIRSNSVWSLFVDSDQRIWIGYYNRGLAVYDQFYDKFKNLESSPSNPNSLKSTSVTGFAKDSKNRLWISMDGGGIDVYNLKSGDFLHVNESDSGIYTNLTSDDIQAIFIDSERNVWAGSWNDGIYVLWNGKNRFENYNLKTNPNIFSTNSIMSFSEDSKGKIWIGTFSNGILSYDLNAKEFKSYQDAPFNNYNFQNSAVRKVIVDRRDNVWVGTTQGLYKISHGKGDALRLEFMADKMVNIQKNATNTNHILTLYEAFDGAIWIGTRGAGLARFDTNKNELKWYDSILEKHQENVTSIIQSQNGNIWIGGNSGISMIDPGSNAYYNYTKNDGLLSDDFNFSAVYSDTSGFLYFGNYIGVDYFKPSSLTTNKNFPVIHLTDLKIFNKTISPNDENSPLKHVISQLDTIVLNHNQSVFTIEYTAINFTRPEKNQYAYYLDGLETDWNYVGNAKSANYTNLDHGTYTFRLKAANNDGVWNPDALILTVIILPPWWKTTWAVITYILLFLLTVYLLNKFYQDRLKEKQLLKNERILRQQEDELHEKKLQFFTNISHEFRTPLTLMINPLKDIMHDQSLKLPEAVKTKHNIIYKNTDRLYRLINELMDLRKLELNKVLIRVQQIELVSFTKNVVNYFQEEANSRNIYLTVDADVREILVWADEGMLEKIIFNLLSNAIKVTPDDGAINIDLLSTDTLHMIPTLNEGKPSEVFEIIVSDTGPGLDEKETTKIFERFYQVENLNKTYYGGTGIGLEVVQNFVNLHKGKIEVKSELGKGTTFKILLLKGKVHFSEPEIVSHKNEMLIQKESYIPQINETDSERKNPKVKSPKTETLLLVEDNVELRNYLSGELSNIYKILTAINGMEGLKLAKQHLPDVILTDVIMPEMDGFHFCKHIKTDIRTSHIPLLMLTAKANIDDRIEGIGYGADAYMVKPFDLGLLKLRLAQLITSRRLIFDKYFGAIIGKDENLAATSIDKEFIQKVLHCINENLSDSDLSVEVLASSLNLSRSQLYRKVKSLTGQTVNEFLRKIRLQKAKQLLEQGSANVSEVCYKVGFSSPSYFTKCFKAHFGKLPTDIEIRDETEDDGE